MSATLQDQIAYWRNLVVQAQKRVDSVREKRENILQQLIPTSQSENPMNALLMLHELKKIEGTLIPEFEKDLARWTEELKKLEEKALIEEFGTLNACVPIAVRRLLDDTTWSPQWMLDTLREHDGTPSELLTQLENHAPIRVTHHFQLSGDELLAHLASFQGEYIRSFTSEEKIIIGYTTSGPENGHFECIQIKDIGQYAGKFHIHTIAYKKEEA